MAVNEGPAAAKRVTRGPGCRRIESCAAKEKKSSRACALPERTGCWCERKYHDASPESASSGPRRSVRRDASNAATGEESPPKLVSPPTLGLTTNDASGGSTVRRRCAIASGQRLSTLALGPFHRRAGT